jgi:ribosomal protein S18 acetylase RimI-like enzyme
MNTFHLLPFTLIVAFTLVANEKISSYDERRDAQFISNFLAKEKKHFPDAQLFTDLKATEITIGTITVKPSLHEIKVYCINDKPVAFIRYFAFNQLTSVIAWLGVDSEYRKKGYAEKLLRLAIKELQAHGVKCICLETLADNNAAQTLYEKVGFLKIECKDSVGTPHTCYTMTFN